MFVKEIFCTLVTSLFIVPAVQGGYWGVNYPPQEMCALRGSSVVIPCTYDYPERFDTVLTVETVKWFRSSIPGITDRDTYVYHSTGINVSLEYKHRTKYLGNKVKNCTLQIRDLQSTDTDKYYFKFETNHPAGKWTGASGVSLSITEPKVTLDPPVPDHTVKEGSFIHLTCGFDRCTLSESSFVWYREGQPISNEKLNKLQFNVSYEHSGKYCCATAENSSFKSEEINLIVKYSPKNTSVSVRAPGGIVEGSSVTLTCTSNANPPVSSYTWFKNQSNVMKSGSEQNLIFANISLCDSGEYYCESSNEIGRQISPAVQIRVKSLTIYFPFFFFFFLSDKMNTILVAIVGIQAAIIFDLLVVICVQWLKSKSPQENSQNIQPSSGGDTYATIDLKTLGSDYDTLQSSFVWYREGQPIRNTTSNNLQFNVSHEHSGNYYCATNENSNIKSKAFKLNVKYPPRNTSVSVSPPGEIVPGIPVILTCSSNANPPVSSYTWFKTSRNHVVKSGPEQSLIFENISLHDSGEYYCESINEIGRSVSLVVPLTVNSTMNTIIIVLMGLVAAVNIVILVVVVKVRK
ncbi:B-cell receptor CD22-like [Huso huso]|uniref:B-cell receptor CD22 n=1 Tax=Huso huso TaxID=61971 RepID=A0ABR0YBB6_HUSHU